MSRTPQGAPGSVLWMQRYGKKIGHVITDKRDGTYVALLNGVFLGRYDFPEDAIDRVVDEGTK